MNADKKARDFSYLLQQPPKLSTPPATQTPADDAEDDEDAVSMAAVMGFSSFGGDGGNAKAEAQRKAELLAARQRGAQPAASAAAAAGLSEGAVLSAEAATAVAERQESSGDEEDDESADEAEGDDAEGAGADANMGLPISHEIDIRHGEHPVLGLTLEPSGARMITGSQDYTVKMWDFHGMDARLQAFRNLLPFEGYPVRDVAFSPKADMVLVCTGSSSVKVVDREGKELLVTKKGDGYLFDLAKTAGHVSIVNSGVWHPTNNNLFLTGSSDGTIRLWDVYIESKSLAVGKCRSKTGKRLHVLSVAFSPDGKLIAAGCSEGTIQLFSATEKVVKLKTQVDSAHAAGSYVSCVVFAKDGKRYLSRSSDGTLKLWDAASPMKPKLTAEHLPCISDRTECCFSPDEQLIVTGSFEEGSSGLLVFLKTETLERVSQFAIGPRAAIRVAWHNRLNQIFLGCSDGVVKVFFDPARSTKGATLCATRRPRAVDPLDSLFGDRIGTVINPHGLKSLAPTSTSYRYTAKRRKEKARADPKLSHKPEPPVAGERGVGKGGRPMGYTSSFSMYIAQRTAYDKTRDQDPREEILKYANKADVEPYFVGKAYAETQPVPVYDLSERDEGEDDKEPKKKKFDPTKRPKLY